MQLSNSISGKESLYRVIKRSRPDWVINTQKISSALFKDPNGVSVDRDGGRAEGDIVQFIIENTFPKRAKAIGMVSAGACFEIEADVEAAPSVDNPYHANIILDRKDENHRNLQALQLADRCKIVYYDYDMEWTN